jgi:hypothetical protein
LKGNPVLPLAELSQQHANLTAHAPLSSPTAKSQKSEIKEPASASAVSNVTSLHIS